MISVPTFEKTHEILRDTITELTEQKKLKTLPSRLYHYTSLETVKHIFFSDDIRLSHAEYSNDRLEMEHAKIIIRETLALQQNSAFHVQVLQNFDTIAATLDAYIFCMSEGSSRTKPQDVLSQWRAYGQDGRGACIELNPTHFATLTDHIPGLRVNPIIYDPIVQQQLVDGILARGHTDWINNLANQGQSVDAAVAALVFVTPLMKVEGFDEEREWRLIFAPPPINPQPDYEFHPRRDFLAPFVTLNLDR